LLDATTETLRELGEALLVQSSRIQSVLQDIQDLAVAADAEEAEGVARRVGEHIDRIAAWSGARQRAWSEYYQYVHRFLRDVVRLDPARVLTHRLREQLSGSGGRAFALRVASAPPVRLLRTVQPPSGERPPVRRRAAERERAVVDAAADDPQARLEASVRSAVERGARGLAEVTSQVTREMLETERYVAVGRIALAVSRVCKPVATAERDWVAVSENLVIEEWTVPEAS
jgi:chromosome partition protein MukF